jgi:hypothetical protein
MECKKRAKLIVEFKVTMNEQEHDTLITALEYAEQYAEGISVQKDIRDLINALLMANALKLEDTI